MTIAEANAVAAVLRYLLDPDNVVTAERAAAEAAYLASRVRRALLAGPDPDQVREWVEKHAEQVRAQHDEAERLRAKLADAVATVAELAQRLTTREREHNADRALMERLRTELADLPVQGALRTCLVPGCLAQYDAVAAMTGERPARPTWSAEGWLTARSAAPVFPAGAHICPRHTGIVKTHLPRRAPADTGHLRAVCACGNWASPQLRWHGAVRGLWEDHLLETLETDTPRQAETPDALHNALHDAIERTIEDNYADTTGGYLVAPWAVAALAARAAMAVLETRAEEADRG